MATGTDGNCPICQEPWDDAASALPCGHRFCLGCILRWANTNPSCPLCRTPTETVRFSERGEQDYVQFVITSPAEPAETGGQAERAAGHPDQNSPGGPAASPAPHLQGTVVSPAPPPDGTLSPAEAGPSGLQSVGGLPLEEWAGLLRQAQHLLEPVRPWLRRRLRAIFRERWWLAEVAESAILHDLCLHGPDEVILVPKLQSRLEEHAAPLVSGLIAVIVSRCCKEAKRLLRFRAAGEDNGASSGGSGSSSRTRSRDRTPAGGPAGSSVQEEAAASQRSLQGSPSFPRAVPNPAEREQPRRSRSRRRGQLPVPGAAATAPLLPARTGSTSPFKR